MVRHAREAALGSSLLDHRAKPHRRIEPGPVALRPDAELVAPGRDWHQISRATKLGRPGPLAPGDTPGPADGASGKAKSEAVGEPLHAPAGAPGVGARGPGSREACLAGPGTRAGRQREERDRRPWAQPRVCSWCAGVPGLQERAAQLLGLSELRLSGGGQSNIAALGKRLSDRAYLTIEQSLTGASILVQLRYDLSASGSLRAETGTDSAVALFLFHRRRLASRRSTAGSPCTRRNPEASGADKAVVL